MGKQRCRERRRGGGGNTPQISGTVCTPNAEPPPPLSAVSPVSNERARQIDTNFRFRAAEGLMRNGHVLKMICSSVIDHATDASLCGLPRSGPVFRSQSRRIRRKAIEGILQRRGHIRIRTAEPRGKSHRAGIRH